MRKCSSSCWVRRARRGRPNEAAGSRALGGATITVGPADQRAHRVLARRRDHGRPGGAQALLFPADGGGVRASLQLRDRRARATQGPRQPRSRSQPRRSRQRRFGARVASRLDKRVSAAANGCRSRRRDRERPLHTLRRRGTSESLRTESANSWSRKSGFARIPS